MEQFTNQYNVQKTLCFEIQPEGVLPEKVHELLAKDKERFLLSSEVKEIPRMLTRKNETTPQVCLSVIMSSTIVPLSLKTFKKAEKVLNFRKRFISLHQQVRFPPETP